MRDLTANRVVSTEQEFDEFVLMLLPELLERATAQTKRFLRDTEQWENDTVHEKLALRWGYELVERFMVCGRSEVPCRPLLLLESFVSKYYSQPEPLCYHKDLLSPLGRYLDALVSRAVVSRDAMTAVFYHLYGFGQSQVVRVLGLGTAESQRVYKNYARWRQGGWQRMVEEAGISEEELNHIEDQKRGHAAKLHMEVERLMQILQSHYRKSEPAHYPCLPAAQWRELFDQDYGHDYRGWHLPLCRGCLADVCQFQQGDLNGDGKPTLNLHVRPLPKAKVLSFLVGGKGR